MEFIDWLTNAWHWLWIAVIVVLAYFLGGWVFLTVALLSFWFADKSRPVSGEFWVFDFQWPLHWWLLVGLAILLIAFVAPYRYRNAKLFDGKARGMPLVARLLVVFVLYLGILHLSWWWVGWLFWLFWLVGLVGVFGMRWTNSAVPVAMASLGYRVCRLIVLLMLVFSMIGGGWSAFASIPDQVGGWFQGPNTVVHSDRDSLGQKASETASPTAEPRGGMVDNSLEQETIDAITVASGAEASPCDWTGVDTKTVAVPEGATNNDTDVDQTVVVYKPGFAVAVGSNGRRYSDSIQLPLKGNATVDQSKDLKKAICEDPLQGVSVANMFAGLKIGDLQRPLTEFNPWLQPFAVDVDQVNDLAASYMPYYGQKELTSDQAKQALTKNVEYQVLANRLGTLLDRIGAVGAKSLTSDHNWHLTNGGVDVDGVPEVGLDPLKDTKPALVYQLTQKNTCKVLLRVGFNTADKRPEVFQVPSCADQAKKAKAAKPTPTATAAAKKSAAPTRKTATTKKNQKPAAKPAAKASTSPKPATANECKIDWHQGCPPNAGDQDPQSNDINTGPSDPDGSPDPISGTIVVPDS
jgi:hypothetical protein